MITTSLAVWFKYFLFGQIIEVPVYVALTSRKVPWRRAAAAGFACTALTHPLLWFGWSRLFHSYLSFAVSGELLVVVIESFIFFLLVRPISIFRATVTAFTANAVSLGLGMLL